jgi:hypothetical protein
MTGSFSENLYAVIGSENVVLNTIVIDSSLTDEEVENLLLSLGENLTLVNLSEIEGVAGVGYEYSDGKFTPPNPEPDTSNYVYESQTNSWIPAVEYPENEPEHKYVYHAGEWVINPLLKIV